MRCCRTATALRRTVTGWREAGESIALVPTMGNLHAGHLALVARARDAARRVVVSVYVNPTQFGPREDFASYPRTFAADRNRLRAAGADLLFAPADDVVYPLGLARATRVCVPELSEVLCGASRPGHFDGVTSVVLRLLHLVEPDCAIFGRKDLQQLRIIQRLVQDLSLRSRIVEAPTVREPDGLALSSRNQYLDAASRQKAPGLYRALRAAAGRLAAGDRDLARVEAEGDAALRSAGLRPDYFAVRRAADLAVPEASDDRLVVLAAAWCGPARLIDNCPVRG